MQHKSSCSTQKKDYFDAKEWLWAKKPMLKTENVTLCGSFWKTNNLPTMLFSREDWKVIQQRYILLTGLCWWAQWTNKWIFLGRCYIGMLLFCACCPTCLWLFSLCHDQPASQHKIAATALETQTGQAPFPASNGPAWQAAPAQPHI